MTSGVSWTVLKRKDFIKAWMGSSTTAEAADKLGLTRGAASAQAGVMRKAGVNLPKYRAKSLTEEIVKELNVLINEIIQKKIKEQELR